MKKATTWSKVRAGDIISFKYKGSNNRLLTHTVVVFSPRYNMQTKKGTKRMLSGLKLEESNRPTVRNLSLLTDVLFKYGDVVVFDAEKKIFKLEFRKKANPAHLDSLYSKMKGRINSLNIYRTYDYDKARRSGVFLEPVKLERQMAKMLLEEYKVSTE